MEFSKFAILWAMRGKSVEIVQTKISQRCGPLGDLL